MRRSTIAMLAFFLGGTMAAQDMTWKGTSWEGKITPDGCLKHIVFKGKSHNDTIPFFARKENAGPVFYVEKNGKQIKAEWTPDGYLGYHATIDDVDCRLTYSQWKGKPALKVTLLNQGHTPFQPTKAGLRLGIDTYMDQYPDWFGKYFPTLLRNEKTHFYGYLQTPKGHMLGIVSPDPVASWSVDYNLGYQSPAPHWFMGHRIESLNLDLMNALPLPQRNPQNLWQLEQGESRTWTIVFVDIAETVKFENEMHRTAGIPVLDIPQTSFIANATIGFDVYASPAVQIEIIDDKNESIKFDIKKTSDNCQHVACTLPEIGLYTVRATDNGKVSEGIISVHQSWEWTLRKAREAAWKYHQKATSHIESWYGFHSAFLAARHFPEKSLDRLLNDRFEYLFGLLHNAENMEPKYHSSRIQNTSGTIGMLVDRYQAYGNVDDLKKASRLADWLINTWQREDGAYVNHNIVYTSVIYVAKSILELTLEERELGKTSTEWQHAAQRHYASAKKAIDQLVDSQGDFETEGELTFEDGMISCSALQIGMLALMQENESDRKHYTEAMLQVLDSHACLTQLRVPDARRRGGTMRYWEAQYDVQMLPNMFNSPHGWSGWRAYATYYAYLLTGNEHWLLETYNAMGAFSHLIDYRSGQLHWAFVVDPYLQVKQACSADTHVTADSLSFGNPHPNLYKTKEFVIGEQYVNMISDWQTVNTQDNDVHELFKFMGEAMLTNAFVIERPDGSLKGYNCKISQQGNHISVTPDERQMTHLHCNLKNAYTVEFNHQRKQLPKGYMGWVYGKDVYQP